MSWRFHKCFVCNKWHFGPHFKVFKSWKDVVVHVSKQKPNTTILIDEDGYADMAR